MKKNVLKHSLWIALSLLLLNSCNNQEWYHFYSIPDCVIWLTAEGNQRDWYENNPPTYGIRIYANLEWTLSASEDWLHYSVDSGEPYKRIYVDFTADPNTTGVVRKGYIRVTLEDGDYKEFEVRQEC